MIRKPFTAIAGLLCSGMILVCTGCQKDRLCYENFAQIRQNVSNCHDVAGCIGEPTDRLGDQWIYQRPSQHLYVIIDFDEQGTVTRKQWVSGGAHVWEDTGETPRPDRSSSERTHIHESRH